MFIKPSRPKYNPDDDASEEGDFVSICTYIHYDIPSKVYAGKFNCAIEFTIIDKRYPKQVDKKCSIVCGQAIYKDKKTGKKSHLYTYLESAGFTNLERGADLDAMLNKRYVCRVVASQGKYFVRGLVPLDEQVTEQVKKGNPLKIKEVETQDEPELPY